MIQRVNTLFSRRTVVSSSVAVLTTIGTGAFTGISAREFSDLNESYEAAEGMYEITWSNDLWKTKENPTEYGIDLVDVDREDYRLSVSYQGIAWGEETVDAAIDGWFNLGYEGVDVFLQWEDDDEMGFAFTSGYGNAPRSMFLFIYSPIESHPDRRRWTTLSVEQDDFDASLLADLLAAVRINDEPISVTKDLDELVSTLEDNLDANVSG